jgi:hypothetical protein
MSKSCEQDQHHSCHQIREGKFVTIRYKCWCHKEKNKVAVAFRGLNYAALNNTIDEVFNNG